MKIILDASTVMTLLLDEPEKNMVLKLTKNSILIVPNVIDYEIGNALSKLHRRKLLTEKEIYDVFQKYRQIPLHIEESNIIKSLEISCKYGIYAYDAYYLEMAFRLKLALISFDKRMKQIARDMNINILEE